MLIRNETMRAGRKSVCASQMEGQKENKKSLAGLSFQWLTFLYPEPDYQVRSQSWESFCPQSPPTHMNYLICKSQLKSLAVAGTQSNLQVFLSSAILICNIISTTQLNPPTRKSALSDSAALQHGQKLNKPTGYFTTFSIQK